MIDITPQTPTKVWTSSSAIPNDCSTESEPCKRCPCLTFDFIRKIFACLRKAIHSSSDYTKKEYHSVKNMYGGDDLSSCPLFKGGLINFGFWEAKDVASTSRLTDQRRIETEYALYRRIFDEGHLSNSESILEVGSGLGFGCILAKTEYGIKKVIGLDFSPDQITRARNIHSSQLSTDREIQFIQGAAENMPFSDEAFDSIVSVEAAQHFSDVNAFLAESHRTLKPNGRLAFTTFFATSSNAIQKLQEYIPTIRDRIDNVVPIEQIREQLEKLGFRDIQIQSIGNHVWPGFDKWISQGELANTWNSNWIRSFNEGLADYYTITATKQG